MAKHKLMLEDFISVDNQIIGIRSRVEDFKLAFLLNKNLGLKLQLEKEEVIVKKKETKAYFSHFTYQDDINSLYWRLLKNRTIVTKASANGSLFDEIDQEVHLVSEEKTADYILKIEDTDLYFDSEILTTKIQSLAAVETCFIIDQQKLKHNTNLIF